MAADATGASFFWLRARCERARVGTSGPIVAPSSGGARKVRSSPQIVGAIIDDDDD